MNGETCGEGCLRIGYIGLVLILVMWVESALGFRVLEWPGAALEDLRFKHRSVWTDFGTLNLSQSSISLYGHSHGGFQVLRVMWLAWGLGAHI